MSDNTSTPKPKTPKGSASKLAERAAKLKAELEATQSALRGKEAQKAALERARLKKDRTRALILLGLAYAHCLRAAAQSKDNPNTPRTLALMQSIIETYFLALPQDAPKTARDKELARWAIEGALNGTFK